MWYSRVYPALLLLILSIDGCTTPYQERGILGTGYTESRLDSTTFQVTYHGDRSMDRDLVERYTLFRCAELTLEQGADYFAVVETSGDMQTDTRISSGSTTGTGFGGTEMSTGTEVRSRDPKFSVTRIIRLHTGTRPTGNATIFDAEQMVELQRKEIRGD